MRYRWNCPGEPFLKAGPKPLLAELGIHHRMKSCDGYFKFEIPECSALRYLDGFLPASLGSVDALTLHDYYLNGRTAKTKDFLNPKGTTTLLSILMDKLTSSKPLVQP